MLKDICSLPENANFYVGAGGSETIVAITENNQVLKYFPLFSYVSETRREITQKKHNFKYEIEVLRLLTNKFIKKNKTPHLVQLYQSYYCRKAPESIFSGCKTFMEKLKTEIPEVKGKTKHTLGQKFKAFFKSIFPSPPVQISYKEFVKQRICSFPKMGTPFFTLEKGMWIADIEHCNMDLNSYLSFYSNETFPIIEYFLNILFFQIFYTLETIKEDYPTFSHGDLFIRNVLGTMKEFRQNTYIRYHYKNKIYDVPDFGFCFKINDFGLTQVDKKLYEKVKLDKKIVKNPYRDVFSILYNVYYGDQLNNIGLYNTIKNKETKKKVEKYFSNFYDTNVIQSIINGGKKIVLDLQWDKTFDPEFIKLIKLVSGEEILKHMENVFPYDKEHTIVNEYGK